MSTPVKLAAILEAMELSHAEVRHLLDRQTGKVVMLMDEEIRAAEEDEDSEEFPEWQRDNIELAKVVQADDGGRFLDLPNQFEINEWAMMQQFAVGVKNPDHAGELLEAIHGRGAFRMFKNCVQKLGLAEDWYKFRDGEYRQAALAWCRENNVEVAEEA